MLTTACASQFLLTGYVVKRANGTEVSGREAIHADTADAETAVEPASLR